MNRATIVGRLTNKPELRYTSSQKAYTKFTVAVNRTYNREEADFINVMAWEKKAELACEYLDKGSLVGIDGVIRTGSFEGEKGKVYTFDIIANEIEFLTPKNNKVEKAEEPEVDNDPYATIGERVELENDEDIE